MKKIIFIFLLSFIFFPTIFVYAQGPVKILLVPGHDNESVGAEYGNLKEADMNLRLATVIFETLNKDKRYKVFITRDSKGYTKEFADYFDQQKNQVLSFIKDAKKKMDSSIASGSFVEKKGVPHNSALDNVVLRLYGFNKWANENKMDAVIHVHFNDYHRKNKWKMGDRKGFAIYIPDEQFENSEASFNLADKIFIEMKKKYTTSNYVNELGGMVFDQKLIGIGANGTLNKDVRSVYMEYGYIYRFGHNAMRQKSYKDMSHLTVKGINNYFFGE